MTLIMFLIFLITANLWANEEPYNKIASLEGGIQTIVDGKVNAISGQFVAIETDLIVPCAHPIELRRTYVNPSNKFKRKDAFWRFNMFGYGQWAEDSEYQHFSATDDNGTFLTSYISTNAKKDWTSLKNDFSKGETNIGRGSISGKSNLKNYRFYFNPRNVVIKTGDGTDKYFTKELAEKWLEVPKESSYLALSAIYFANGFCNYITHKNGTSYWLTAHAMNQDRMCGILFDDIPAEQFKRMEHPYYVMYAEDGRHVRYDFERIRKDKSWYGVLKKVSGQTIPTVTYDYDSHHEHLIKRTDSEGGFYQLEYYQKNKKEYLNACQWKNGSFFWTTLKIDPDSNPWYVDSIKGIKAPSGYKDQLIETHRFVYWKEPRNNPKTTWTDVYDYFDHLTCYHFDKNFRPTKIIQYDGRCGDYVPDIIDETFWGNPKDLQETNLQTRVISDGKDLKNFKGKHYTYDSYGNVKEETFFGNLTGEETFKPIIQTFGKLSFDKQQTYTKKSEYSTDNLNNLKKETFPSGLIIEYNYIDKTDKIYNKKIHELINYNFYYSNGGIIEKEEVSDGVYFNIVKRHLLNKNSPCYGLPLQTEELYLDQQGEEHILKKTLFEYHRNGQLAKRTTYGSNHEISPQIEQWTDPDVFDHCKQEILKTGELILREYDSLGHIIKEIGPDPDYIKTFHYDKMHRLREKKETFHKIKKTTYFNYDEMGRLKSTIDPYSQKTDYVTDRYGRIIETILPEMVQYDGTKCRPVFKTKYDAFNHEIEKVDPRGHIISTKFTAYDKPYSIYYPDGTHETYQYDIASNLVEFTAKNGRKTKYYYDKFNRVYQKDEQDEYSNWQSEITTYIGSLISSIQDASGAVRFFEYDGAGRKVLENYGDSTKKFEYDNFGRLSKTIHLDGQKILSIEVKQYDAADRVIESWTEDETGVRHRQISLKYDFFGNVYMETQGESTTFTFYDPWKRILKKIDSEGHVTSYIYEETSHLIKREIDEETGFQTVEIYDSHGRVIEQQRLGFLSVLIQKVNFYYDASGNKTDEVHTVFGRENEEIQRIHWEYNSMNQVILMFEASDTSLVRRTEYSFKLGEKEWVKKPDGLVINYDYYLTGRLEKISSSDNSCYYHYSYDALGRTTKITDLIDGLDVERFYTTRGNIEFERYNNFEFKFDYDSMDRPTKITFPDKTIVEYTYNCYTLTKIIRLDLNEQQLYEHSYSNFDQFGNAQTETLIDGSTRNKKYDLLNRLLSIKSDNFSVTNLIYDHFHRLRERTVQLPDVQFNDTFNYDPLNQLIDDNQARYSYDSLYNRLSINDNHYQLNGLNQVKNTLDEFFEYDLNGNLKKRIQNGVTTIYDYDTLNRLISVTTLDQTIKYKYDGLNRRLIKLSSQKQEFWLLGDNEVGSCINGTLKEFRILGLGLGAEIGATISLELDGITYLPHHDQIGNLIGIENPSFRESYRYTAFGEHIKESNRISPWGFASKRLDPETGFLYFGKRFYDPTLGRFTTCDPSGYSDGINLYAYVHNTPLTHFDLYGLFDLLEGLYSLYGSIIAFQMGVLTNPFADLKPSKLDYSSNTPYFIEAGERVDPGFKVTAVGGLGSEKDGSLENAQHCSKMSNGYKVNYLHNGTFGLVKDAFRWGSEVFRNRYTEVSKILTDDWNRYLTDNPTSYIFHYCHSEGVAVTNNSLKLLHEDLRNRVIICAIAPGCYPNREISNNIKYFVSKHDVVHRLDFWGFLFNQDRIEYLNAHQTASMFDHDFTSLTFFEPCQKYFNNQIARLGIK